MQYNITIANADAVLPVAYIMDDPTLGPSAHQLYGGKDIHGMAQSLIITKSGQIRVTLTHSDDKKKFTYLIFQPTFGLEFRFHA